jgi:hypothetical protein
VKSASLEVNIVYDLNRDQAMKNTTTKYKWQGQSGTHYEYVIYPINKIFTEKNPGNYILAKLTEDIPGQWIPQSIGQTSDLTQTFIAQSERKCAIRHGAMYLHVHVSDTDEQIRTAEVMDLIAKHFPPCNPQ